MLRIIIIVFVLLFQFECNSFASRYKDIVISGNQRVSIDSIKGIINFNKNNDYSENDLNNIQKKLFETNFFQKVDIIINNEIISISVVENPIINFFYIEGEDDNKRNELIYEKISLNQNTIFSESLLNEDINKIKNIYEDFGYYNVKIDTELSKLDNNLVNLLLKISKGKRSEINRIFFVGDKFFSTSTLNDVISSTQYGWWKFLSSSTTANDKRIEYDKALLKKFYLDEGFYDIEILSNDIIFENNNAIITFSINSGSRYNFKDFKIIDDYLNFDEYQLNEIKNIVSKDFEGFFSSKALNNIQKKIYNYLDKNKIEFVKLDTAVIKQKNEISVDFIFNKSPRKYVNSININGNSITEEKVIRRALLFSEGDSFTSYKLSESKKKLDFLSIFKDVTIEPQPKENSKELLDIFVTVKEQPTGAISAGVGIGSAESNIQTGISESNLFGKGIRANIGGSFGTEKITGSINLILPDFNNTDNQLGFDIFAISTDFDNAGYESSKVGSNVFTKYELFENVFLKNGVGFDIDDISANASASSLYKSREGKYSTFKGFYTLERDTRNRYFQPTDGHKFSFGQTFAVPGSDVSYVENYLYASKYHQVSEDFIFNLKGSLNSINSLDKKDVKLSDRQFSTQGQLRGFQARGVGPIDGNEHVGGNYSAFSTVSSTFPNGLPEKWNAKTLAFIDIGNVWGVDYDSSLDSNEIRSSVGIALDWMSPVGPINFTIAEPISSAGSDKKESFTFNLGSAF